MNGTDLSLNIKDAVASENEIAVRLSDGTNIKLCHFWFRDSCRCGTCYNHQTFQRMYNILDIPEDAKPIRLSFEANILHIEWSDNHRSEYSAQFLWECWPLSGKTFTKRVLWSGAEDVQAGVAYVKRDDFLKSKEALGRFLRSLVTYGVAFVDDVQPTMEDTTLVIKRVGPLQNTLFGDTWHFTSNLARADTAYTSIPLGPHTDNLYFTEAAGLQILHCLEHDGEGGETILLDGFKHADDLRNTEPEMFDILTKIYQPGEYHEEGYHHHCEEPTIILERTGELKQIRFNVYDRSSHCVATGKELEEYYKAYKTLARKYNIQEVQWKFKLKPGRVLFFDNWRVLHGRAGFTGKRYIGGAYISRGDFLSAARLHGIVR